MSKIRLRDGFDPECPIRNVLSRVSDKWSLLVLYTLQVGGVIRFKELQRELPDISQKMLTVTLRTLQEDGFVVRKAYPTIPPKVEYSLSERAHSFMTHITPLVVWSKENMESIIKDREQNNK